MIRHLRLVGTTALAGIVAMAFAVQAPLAADMKSDPAQRAVENASPERVDAQIKELHDKLHITQAQEGKWKDVAEAMHDTAKEVRSKLTETDQKAKDTPRTAVEELRSYRDLQQVQYDGVKRLLDPFEKLYADMTPEQKKNADELFERPHEAAAAGGGSAHHHSEKGS